MLCSAMCAKSASVVSRGAGLARRADVNTCCHMAPRYGDKAELRTPLHWAAMMGDARLVDFLLDKGAETSRLATGCAVYPCADVTPLIAGFQVMYACHDLDWRNTTLPPFIGCCTVRRRR